MRKRWVNAWRERHGEFEKSEARRAQRKLCLFHLRTVECGDSNLDRNSLSNPIFFPISLRFRLE